MIGGKKTYDTLIRIHSTEEERRDLVLLQVETKWCLSVPEPKETIFAFPSTYPLSHQGFQE